MYAGHDRYDFIELPAIENAIAEPYERLAAVRMVPSGGSGVERSAALGAIADAMVGVADAVDGLPDDVLDDDLPARQWATDWRTMAASVRGYAAALAAGGTPTFVTPLTPDGYTIVARMEVATSTCEVPNVVVRLDQESPRLPEWARDRG